MSAKNAHKAWVQRIFDELHAAYEPEPMPISFQWSGLNCFEVTLPLLEAESNAKATASIGISGEARMISTHLLELRLSKRLSNGQTDFRLSTESDAAWEADQGALVQQLLGDIESTLCAGGDFVEIHARELL